MCASVSYTKVFPYCQSKIDAVVDHFYRLNPGWSNLNFEQRLLLGSERLLGKKYYRDALGEGPEGEFDQSPHYRFDCFDCVTYVNTVLALAMSFDLAQFQEVLNTISYREGVVSYENRHHFMEVDWNRCNAMRGVVHDVTTEIFSFQYLDYAQTKIDKPAWYHDKKVSDLKLLNNLSAKQIERLLAHLHHLGEKMLSEVVSQAYVPISSFFHHQRVNTHLLHEIPNGAVVEIIRPNWNQQREIGTHLNVSHVGFIVWHNKDVMLRHASVETGKVIEQDLMGYLLRQREKPGFGGINIQQVLFKN